MEVSNKKTKKKLERWTKGKILQKVSSIAVIKRNYSSSVL